MAITKEKKTEVVEKIKSIAKEAKTLVFANFKGLTVAEVTEMRKSLRAQGIGYTVAKKTLLRRGLEAGGFAGEVPALEGEVALAWGPYSAEATKGEEDELAPAREIGVFVKKFGDHLSFVGGMFGGKFVGKDEIVSISAIPGTEALRAQFVQLINSPLQRFAVVLNAKADKGQ
jgi:large subunit ribosomal protein L10